MVIVCNRSLFNKYGWMAFVCYFENSKGTSMTQTEALRFALQALEYEAQKGNDNAYQFEREAIKAALEAKDEPVAYVKTVVEALYENSDPVSVEAAELLERITTPPQRTWVGLTDEEIAEVEDEYIVDYRIPAGSAWNFAKDIEAKLKEKNT
jgi:hypothetical protein